MTERQTIIPEQSRNYGIDALRILSMMMVVTLHVLGHGGILNSAEFHSVKYWVLWFIEFAAFCAVNCYALISGYVGVYAKYRFSNLASLWCRVAFYSIVITLICKIVSPEAVGKGALLYSFFPVITEQYWYFTSYAVMFLFVPILNIALDRLPKKEIGCLLLLIITVASVIFPILCKFTSDWLPMREGYSPWWLMILYLVGGYIRKYGLFQKVRTFVFPLLYLVTVTLTLVLKYVIQVISQKLFGEIKYEGILTTYTWITILMAAVFLLLTFERIRFSKGWIRVVAFFSPLAFSVYLIHEQGQIKNRFIADKFVWVLNLPLYQMIPLIIGLVLGIYMLCSVLDLLRHYLFNGLQLKRRLSIVEKYVVRKLRDR